MRRMLLPDAEFRGVTHTRRDSRYEREEERSASKPDAKKELFQRGGDIVVGCGRQRNKMSHSLPKYSRRGLDVCNPLPGMEAIHLCPMTTL